jgi:class 3 adenylate cyclase
MSRLSHSDLPLLRNFSHVYGSMIDHANRLKAASNDVGELLAVASVLDQLETERDRCQRNIKKLSA